MSFKVVAVSTRQSEQQSYVLKFSQLVISVASLSDISGVANNVRLNLREKMFPSNRILNATIYKPQSSFYLCFFYYENRES